MIIGGDSKELSAYIGKEFSGDATLGDDLYFDLNEPHMITICGKRGSGKSHTLGVFMEEVMELPKQAKENLSGLVIDSMGIYWSLQVENQNSELLPEWDMEPDTYPVKVYYPGGLEDQYGDIQQYFHKGFELYPSELSVDDWLFLLNIGETQAQAGLLSTLLDEVEEEYGQFWSLNDLIKKLELTEESDNIKNALSRRLQKAKSWGIFSASGQTIEEIIAGGEFAVLDLSGAGALPWNVRTLLTGILVKKIYAKRSFQRSKEEVERVRGSEAKAGFPLVWLFIDEAHLFAPSGSSTPSTEPLVEWVRQGRRPGLSLVMATQQPGALDSRILSQCDTLFIHRVTAGKDADAVGNKISELHNASSISMYMKNMPKKPGYVYIMNDQEEDLYPVKIRPRRSWHAGGSAKLDEYID